ncbi:peptidase domain-containing ABC transporter [Enterococcus plantarum]|uniref:peptidase domain-containing ABC transporter n=1 Tax=Enterococcus plantarum TaxID=1077675 RepID=UPI001A90B44F|nr:peptidase domain-containing ABC transporter [Enterococcus plantarum]MBO0466673.1 peptidase domain-containing ABC transporter [Enterococcus plantarum]
MRIRFQKQSEHSECGLACATMLIDFFIRKTELSKMREYYGVPTGGYNLAQIQTVLKNEGIESKAVKVNSESLQELPVPFIAYWKNKHFIIVEKVTSKKVYITDPANGKKKISHTEFKHDFSNIAMYILINRKRKYEFPKINSKLKSIVYNNKSLLFFTLFIFFIVQCINLYIPFIIQKIIDGNSNQSIQKMIFSVLLIILIYFLTNMIRTRTVTSLQTVTEKNLLSNTIKQLLDLPYSYFVNRNRGELIYRINSSSFIRQILIDQLITLVVDMCFLVFYVLIMWNFSKILTMVTIGITVVIATFSFINASINRKISQNEIGVLSNSQDLINEMVNNIFTIKSTNSQKNMYMKWQNNYEKQISFEKEKAKANSISANIPQTIQTFYSVIVYAIGYILVLNNQTTIGSIVAFSSIGIAFLSPILSILQSYTQFQMVKVYLDRLLDILQTSNETSLSGTEKLDNYLTDIYIRNIMYKYSSFSKPAIENISLHIAPKQKIAIVGESGSGKSTLLKVAAGLHQSTSGEICYGKRDIKDLDIHTFRDHIGVVLQENVLFNGTFRENITMGRDYSDEYIMEVVKNVGLESLILGCPLGLETNISELGQNLSGGQRQKLSIARTIIFKPEVIFLDEPTSSLDNISERAIMNYLFGMDSTLVVVAHRLSSIQNFDQIIVMNDGKIVALGTHQELLNTSYYYKELYK